MSVNQPCLALLVVGGLTKEKWVPIGQWLSIAPGAFLGNACAGTRLLGPIQVHRVARCIGNVMKIPGGSQGIPNLFYS